VFLKGGFKSLSVLQCFPNNSIYCMKLQKRLEYHKHKITITVQYARKLNITKKIQLFRLS
jgi:hypothetical protein